MKNKINFEQTIQLNEQDLLKIIDRQKLPKHIAIIMDGNGRWALKRGLPRSVGHLAGAESLKGIVEICYELKIEVLTVYGFSTENWKRPQQEINYLMNLIIEYLNKEIGELCKKGVRVNSIGTLQELPQSVQDVIANSVERSRDNSGLVLNLALNYGGRLEITNAVRAIAEAVEVGCLKASQVDIQTITDHLYTAGLPDPDLLIRTAGEFRISNFLLWQLAYSEIWFTNVLWPDFRRQHLLSALVDYQQRERRFGGLQ
ncbi:isoprenyl transferase [Desulfoscipio geothermicus]|uniref:Isoprenyl transferase n=1 Tax=Desulfoscipio geothermicus DSM 3669 TaxID=1121426 RepID=A0A1I6E6D6_9FIRM|nr:isoprenyl transferase [Desulfoscipio geothermicus]SFR13309.1 Undecaprenyl pyrophosphate synthetase [Desulfoscipio geothermicus DSM 3669]